MDGRRNRGCVSGTWCTYECGGGCTKTSHLLNAGRNQTMSYFFFSGKLHQKIQKGRVKKKIKMPVWLKPQYKTANNSPLPAEQSAWYKNIYSSHLHGIVCETEVWKNKPLPTRSTTRLNWKRNQSDGFGLETGVPLPSGLAHPDRRGWGGGGIRRRRRMCGLDTWHGRRCLPECAKQFSTWVLTAKPQHPNQLLSHQRPKPCSYATISEMLCCV